MELIIMPDLYVCSFTRVAYGLRHAEIRVQGYTIISVL